MDEHNPGAVSKKNSGVLKILAVASIAIGSFAQEAPAPKIDPTHLAELYRAIANAQPLNIAVKPLNEIVDKKRAVVLKDCDVPGWEVYEPPFPSQELPYCRRKPEPPTPTQKPAPIPPAASQPKP